MTFIIQIETPVLNILEIWRIKNVNWLTFFKANLQTQNLSSHRPNSLLRALFFAFLLLLSSEISTSSHFYLVIFFLKDLSNF